jgi:hypothetical protein
VRSKDSSRQKAVGSKQKAESRQKANADAASLYLECANFGVRRLDGALVGCDLSQHSSGNQLDYWSLINNCHLPTSHCSLLTAHCSPISVNVFAAFSRPCILDPILIEPPNRNPFELRSAKVIPLLKQIQRLNRPSKAPERTATSNSIKQSVRYFRIRYRPANSSMMAYS